ncbi:MAG: hypothetical protein LRY73_01665 [Bacillus sp. (in: Bacteria)]|nr:hypothetical protein [Bacillus sp. (in: firmicutes)]
MDNVDFGYTLILRKERDSSKMLTHFLRAWDSPTKHLKVLREKQQGFFLRRVIAGAAKSVYFMNKLRFVSTKEETEDPAGTRRLKRCPRKASSCSINQQQRITKADR